MKGSVLRPIGIALVVLGLLALVGGVAAAGFGYVSEEDAEDEVVRNGEEQERNQALVWYGVIVAGAGLVLLLVGGVAWAVGNGRRDAAMLEASGGAPSHEEAGGWGLGAVLGVLVLVGLLGVGLWALGGDSGAFDSASTSQASAATAPLAKERFEGDVQGGATTGSSLAAPSSDNLRVFSVPSGGSRVETVLAWNQTDNGADTLQFILEREYNGSWQELGRDSGASPIRLTVSGLSSQSDLRYRVFPGDGEFTASQPFTVTATFWAR